MKAPSPLSASRQPDEASRVRSAREFPWTKEKDGLLGKLTHRVLTEKLNRTLSGVRDRRIAEVRSHVRVREPARNLSLETCKRNPETPRR